VAINIAKVASGFMVVSITEGVGVWDRFVQRAPLGAPNRHTEPNAVLIQEWCTSRCTTRSKRHKCGVDTNMVHPRVHSTERSALLAPNHTIGKNICVGERLIDVGLKGNCGLTAIKLVIGVGREACCP
jgi:hypothetical protein